MDTVTVSGRFDAAADSRAEPAALRLAGVAERGPAPAGVAFCGQRPAHGVGRDLLAVGGLHALNGAELPAHGVHVVDALEAAVALLVAHARGAVVAGRRGRGRRRGWRRWRGAATGGITVRLARRDQHAERVLEVVEA